MEPLYWASPVSKCDLCHVDIAQVFIDGKTDKGPWGCMCILCHALHGYGLGMGRGQKYSRQSDGKWLKTEG